MNKAYRCILGFVKGYSSNSLGRLLSICSIRIMCSWNLIIKNVGEAIVPSEFRWALGALFFQSFCVTWADQFPAIVPYRQPLVNMDTSYLRTNEWERSILKGFLFMFRRSFSELSEVGFIPLHYAIVRQHLKYSMETNSPNPTVDSHLECTCLQADLILAFKMFQGVIYLSPSVFFLHPPRTGLRGHAYRTL